ncbi:MAG: TolC family protein, partial [Bdellovibrionales bacterium]
MKKTTALLCLLLSAVPMPNLSHASDYARPDIKIPVEWKNKPELGVVIYSPWWMRFGDETLNKLIEEVLAKNNNLAAATLKVREARLRADLALDQFLPDLSATASASNSRKLSGTYKVTRTYSAAANASYEVDLWGKLASEMDSAEWEAMATEEDKESTALSLVGT